MEKTNRIAICDDHIVIRFALRQILSKSKENIIVAEAERHENLIKLLDKNPADILFIDISLPGISGLETIYQVRQKYPNIKIIVFSIHESYAKIESAILNGANGYLIKDASIEEIFDSVNKVRLGEIFLQPKIEHLRCDIEKKFKNDKTPLQTTHPLKKLSKREREVFMMLSEGQANRIIAKKMHLSTRTVETHRARILKKLSLGSTSDILLYAIKNNILSI